MPEDRTISRLSAIGGANAIASKLRSSIIEGDYAYRERMPSERQLAEVFGAARGTIRAALQHLEEMNLITRRPGSGSFVCYRGFADHEDIAEMTSPLELIEVRIAIEPAMARLAVANANAQDIERLAEVLDRLEQTNADPVAFSSHDEAFHLALAECARNPLMLWLYRHINEVRGHAQWMMRRSKVLTPRKIQLYNQHHRDVFTAISRRDVDQAERSIRQHLTQAKADLLGE
jgi:DNA-binding FadR family transcriptional regulator